MRSESEVDALIEDLKNRSKGKYITQGCSFNKTCPRQMALLKQALMESASFSGLVKEMLALRFGNHKIVQGATQNGFSEPQAPRTKNIGNFI